MCISSSIGFVAPRCAQGRFPPLRQVKARMGTHRHELPAVRAMERPTALSRSLAKRMPEQDISGGIGPTVFDCHKGSGREAVRPSAPRPAVWLAAWQARVEHRVRRVGVGETLDPAALEPVVEPRGIALLIASVSATGPPPRARPPVPSRCHRGGSGGPRARPGSWPAPSWCLRSRTASVRG
jgi:hypothetical protein